MSSAASAPNTPTTRKILLKYGVLALAGLIGGGGGFYLQHKAIEKYKADYFTHHEKNLNAAANTQTNANNNTVPDVVVNNDAQ
jgi:hypothetical protein